MDMIVYNTDVAIMSHIGTDVISANIDKTNKVAVNTERM
jgi:hypothetical protein